jgi:1,4-alpha-glucan branching enzyme
LERVFWHLTVLDCESSFAPRNSALRENKAVMAKSKIATQKVVFSHLAPGAKSVLLAGDFTEWQDGALALKQFKGGLWKKTVSLAPGRYAYRLIVDGVWRDDPQCPHREPNEFGAENCVCVVTATDPA